MLSNFDFTALLDFIKSLFEAFRKLMTRLGFEYEGPQPEN